MNERRNIIKAYIVAEWDGNRFLIPLNPDAQMTITREYDLDEERFQARHGATLFNPRTIKIELTGTTDGFTVWRPGDNPEDLIRDRQQLAAQPLELGELKAAIEP